MSPPQADKAGLHILLKLAALVIILAGIHAAADILVQLLLALFFAIVLNPLVTWFIRRGVRRPFAITLVVTAMLVMLTALLGVLAASLNDFVAMLPDFNRALTRKIVQLQEYLPFQPAYQSGAHAATYGFRTADDLGHDADDPAFRGDGQHCAAGDDGDLYAF